MSSYLSRAASVRRTPQSEPIPGSSQVQNNAGGFAWELSALDRLRRFLVLGSEGGTYYVGESKLTRQNIDALRAALDESGLEAVRLIVDVSERGRAPKPDQAIYALSVACAHTDAKVRKAALGAIPRVCRTGTHLFMFCEFVEQHRGWGPALRKAIGKWYVRDDLEALAYQLVKYRQRGGWTHRDVLRLAHVKPPTEGLDGLYGWACGRDLPVVEDHKAWPGPWPTTVVAYERARCAADAKTTALLVREYGNVLPREALNPEHLTDPDVWMALLEHGMPMTALIRNLATMTRVGVVKPLSEGTKLVCDQLADGDRLRRARVHPLSLLIALATYAFGKGFRGSGTWEPVKQVVDALDAAFYESFQHVEPTGKRYVLALDCSHSMNQPMSGCPMLTCMAGAAAMAMVTERVEKLNAVIAFHGHVVPLTLGSRQRLDDVVVSLPRSVGRTDCALPMLWAERQGIEADVFLLYSDNEIWSGAIHPSQALQQYRRATGIDARLAVVSMTATSFSIADPNDRGMLDCVGFDTSTPQVLSEFAAGRL